MTTIVSPRPVYIYALLDPRTDEVRYVGRTTDPKRRLAEHHARREIQRPNHRGRWIKSLLAAGLRPLMRVLEATTAELWSERERHYVATYRAAGAHLTNATDGGDGCLNVIIRPETRVKLGRIRKGVPWTDQQRAMLSRAHKGKKWSEAQRVTVSRARKGQPGRAWTQAQRAAKSEQMRKRPPRVWTDAERAKLSASRTGVPLTPEHRAKLSQAHKGQTLSAAHRAKLSAVGKGRVFTPEHRANISAARKGHGRPWSAARRAAHERRYGRRSPAPEQLSLGL